MNQDVLIQMKPPFSYYGGKQKLASQILKVLPTHVLYCEPFLGGGAVFWAKPPSDIEVLNDTNRELMNFYRTVQNDFVALETEVRISLHSRDIHRKANVIYQNPDMFSEVKRAWAVWALATQSFSAMLDGSFGYDISRGRTSKVIAAKRAGFTEEYAIRLQNVTLECADALYIIKSRDAEGSLFYCDPPYFNSNCGHYDGYSEADFEALLTTLSSIKGKFLLSSYDSEILKRFTAKFGWPQVRKEMMVSVNAKGKNGKRKIEVLTSNFTLI
jgi:DNA adenine methylase